MVGVLRKAPQETDGSSQMLCTMMLPVSTGRRTCSCADMHAQT